MMDIGCSLYDMNYLSKKIMNIKVSMHYIFNRKWIVEVLLVLLGVVLVMVSVLLGVIGEDLVHVVG